MLDGLANPDKDVRQAAAIALGELADDCTAETLARRLWDEPDFYVRETLTWALTQVAPPARPAVVDALSDPRPEARTQALHVLSKFADPEVVPDILPLLRDESESVAEKARWALSRIGDPRAVPELARLLGHGDLETRNGLTTTLAAFAAHAVPSTTEALSSTDAAVRQHAADVLCHIGAPAAEEAAPDLGRALGDPDTRVALAALMALGELPGATAGHLIEQTRDSHDPTLREVAQRLIEKREAQPSPADSPDCAPCASNAARDPAAEQRPPGGPWQLSPGRSARSRGRPTGRRRPRCPPRAAPGRRGSWRAPPSSGAFARRSTPRRPGRSRGPRASSCG